MFTVLIDADGCPVVDITVRLCRPRGIPVLILCDTAHRIERDGLLTAVHYGSRVKYRAAGEQPGT